MLNIRVILNDYFQTTFIILISFRIFTVSAVGIENSCMQSNGNINRLSYGDVTHVENEV